MTDKAGLEIRFLEEADVPSVVALEQESFGTPWSEETVRTAIVRAEETAGGEQEEAACKAAYGAFGAFYNEKLVGYLFAMAVAGESELHRIAAARRFRRQGIGDALMEHFLSWSLSYGEEGIWLEIRAGNEAAAALYKKHGFLESGRRRRYYRNPTEDALIFHLREIPSVYH